MSVKAHNHSMGPTTPSPGKLDPCCRCRAQLNPARAGTFMPLSASYHKPGPDTLSTGHTYECTTCTMRYSWTRNEQGGVYLETSVSIDLTSPVRVLRDPRVTNMAADVEVRKNWVDKWVKHAHPESWGFTECKELKHVYWCDDKDCSTTSRWTRLTQFLRDQRV